MSKKNKQKPEAGVENVDMALSKAERFIEDNQKIITIVVGVILGVLAIIVGFRKFYLAPQEKEAQSQMFYAEKYFEADSFNLALNGDGNNLGFVDIIDNYGITKSGNLAKYYAGICNLRMENFEEALDYLKKYRLKDEILSTVALGAIGDAYVELNEMEKGLGYYKKATDVKGNPFTTPIYLMKLALLSEELGEFDNAVEAYKRIQSEFGSSEQARNIEKYIVRAEASVTK